MSEIDEVNLFHRLDSMQSHLTKLGLELTEIQKLIKESNLSLTYCRSELSDIKSTLNVQGRKMMWVLIILLSLTLWRVW
jgi:hypothetical protein